MIGLRIENPVSLHYRIKQTRFKVTKLAEWVDQNKVNIHIDKTFSLDEAGQALDYLRDIHPRGKIVLAA